MFNNQNQHNVVRWGPWGGAAELVDGLVAGLEEGGDGPHLRARQHRVGPPDPLTRGGTGGSALCIAGPMGGGKGQ